MEFEALWRLGKLGDGRNPGKRGGGGIFVCQLAKAFVATCYSRFGFGSLNAYLCFGHVSVEPA